MTDDDYIATLPEDARLFVAEFRRLIAEAAKDLSPAVQDGLHCAILLDDEVVPTDFIVWSIWHQINPEASIVAKDQVGNSEVSTVFIHVAQHGINPDKNYHFETMIFGPDSASVEDRYLTLADAVAGHHATTRRLRNE
jgi:hypothetical protein